MNKMKSIFFQSASKLKNMHAKGLKNPDYSNNPFIKVTLKSLRSMLLISFVIGSQTFARTLADHGEVLAFKEYNKERIRHNVMRLATNLNVVGCLDLIHRDMSEGSITEIDFARLALGMIAGNGDPVGVTEKLRYEAHELRLVKLIITEALGIWKNLHFTKDQIWSKDAGDQVKQGHASVLNSWIKPNPRGEDYQPRNALPFKVNGQAQPHQAKAQPIENPQENVAVLYEKYTRGKFEPLLQKIRGDNRALKKEGYEKFIINFDSLADQDRDVLKEAYDRGREATEIFNGFSTDLDSARRYIDSLRAEPAQDADFDTTIFEEGVGKFTAFPIKKAVISRVYQVRLNDIITEIALKEFLRGEEARKIRNKLSIKWHTDRGGDIRKITFLNMSKDWAQEEDKPNDNLVNCDIENPSLEDFEFNLFKHSSFEDKKQILRRVLKYPFNGIEAQHQLKDLINSSDGRDMIDKEKVFYVMQSNFNTENPKTEFLNEIEKWASET